MSNSGSSRSRQRPRAVKDAAMSSRDSATGVAASRSAMALAWAPTERALEALRHAISGLERSPFS
jgi:hypothetical protein